MFANSLVRRAALALGIAGAVVGLTAVNPLVSAEAAPPRALAPAEPAWLYLESSMGSEPVGPGKTLRLNYVLHNQGQGPAEGVRILSFLGLPENGLRFRTVENTVGTWKCLPAGIKVDCLLAGSLAPNAPAPRVTLVVDILPTAPAKQNLQTVASVYTRSASAGTYLMYRENIVRW